MSICQSQIWRKKGKNDFNCADEKEKLRQKQKTPDFRFDQKTDRAAEQTNRRASARKQSASRRTQNQTQKTGAGGIMNLQFVNLVRQHHFQIRHL